MRTLDWMVAVFFATLIGSAFAAQTGINAQLRIWLGAPLQAALISFGTGALLLACISTLTLGWHWPAGLSQAPKWIWLGGSLGAFIVAGSILLAPRLGSFALTAIIVSSQMLTALMLDSYGLLGFQRVEMSWSRWMGAGLIVTGMILAIRKPG